MDMQISLEDGQKVPTHILNKLMKFVAVCCL
jgi:hypothetical protein